MGKEATILVRPVLKVNDRKCDLSLLKNTKITITTTDNKQIPVTKTFADLSLSNKKELSVSFFVPPNLVSVSVYFEGDVKNISRDSMEKKSYSQSFYLENYNNSIQFYETYLRRFKGNYFVYVLGKNGEAMEDTTVQFSFTHRILGLKENIEKKTDGDGKINLGPLQGIININA